MQGSSPWDENLCAIQQTPRKSWLRRREQEAEALKQGLIEWQVNSYYCAGRVTVPAVMDTFTCQAFFKRVSGMPQGADQVQGDRSMAGMDTLIRQAFLQRVSRIPKGAGQAKENGKAPWGHEHLYLPGLLQVGVHLAPCYLL